MPFYLSDLNADAPPFLTTSFLKSSLSQFLASGRILVLFLCDLIFGPPRPEDTISALFAKANYAADFKVSVCGSTFPVVDNWLTFLPSAKVCLEVPWFFTLLAVLMWSIGVACFVQLVLSLVWLLLRGTWLTIYFLLESVGKFGYWTLGVLGRGLGMSEEVEGVVPVVVVVDTEL